jgi:hypothetical protein
VIRYHYLQQLVLPAPFVNVTLQNPVTGDELRDVPAQLDTAADRTVLPDTLVQALTLPQVGAILIGGVGGLAQTMPSYPVRLAVHDLPALMIEAVGSPGETWVLLGRDVLNTLRLLLDGPNLVLEIG